MYNQDIRKPSYNPPSAQQQSLKQQDPGGGGDVHYHVHVSNVDQLQVSPMCSQLFEYSVGR